MKRFLALVFLLFPSFVFAADMQLKAPPPRVVVGCDWCGFYIGIHGGGAWSHDDLNTIVGTPIASLKPSGSVLGAQAGYLWQYSNVAAGFEIDYSHLGFTDTKAIAETVDVGVHVRDLASARARVGYVLLPGMLAYVTAGAAWGSAEAFITSGATTLTASASSLGWTAGGGLEVQILQSLRLRGEYLHYDLGNANFNLVGVTAPSRFHVDVARAALSYRFGP